MTASLPQGFTSRAPQPDELKKVFEFIREYELAEYGESNDTLQDYQDSWNRPNFNLATDALLVLDPAGNIAGYVAGSELHQPAMGGTGYTGPAYSGRGIGSYMVGWLDERMTSQIPEFGPEMEIVFSNWIHSGNEAARALLVNNGYQQTREFWQMQILLAEPPAAPTWPAGISIRPMLPGQEDRLVYDVYEETFSDHWGHVQHPYEEFVRRYYEREKFDPSLWFLAIDDATGEVAGYTLDSAEDKIGWVNTLAVRRPYRRSGLGLALLRHSFVELYNRGLREVRLMVDGQSLTGATRLYIGAGMNPFLRFARYDKVIRPGVSVSVKELAE